MLKTFRSYQLAKELYTTCKTLPAQGEVRDQLLRASLSVCLNLAEGSGKLGRKDQRKFYVIALGSLRETQAIIDIENYKSVAILADNLGACIWRLIQNTATDG